MRRALRPVLLLLLLPVPALAHPHISPALWLDLEIRQREVVLVVSTEITGLAAWGLDPASLVEPMPDEARAFTLATATAYFAKTHPLRIDGARAVPAGRGVQMPKDDLGIELAGYLSFTFAYPCEQVPRTVSIRWEDFSLANWQEQKVVPGLVKFHPQVDTFSLSPEEPEYVWHAPVEGAARRHAVARVASARLRIPLLSLGLLLAGALGVLLARGAGHRLGIAAAALLLAALLRDRALYAWPSRVERPGQSQAARIFGSLEENLYAAFDAPTEGAIYDLLAASVEPQVLDPIYVEICESLILRQQGGAVATVERVENVETRIDFPGGDAPAFEAHWKWRVHCAVSHWGHTHRRINEYEAIFRVRNDGDAWRIASFEVLDRKRIDE